MVSGSEIDWLGAASVPLLITGLLAFGILYIVVLFRAPTDVPAPPGVHQRTSREVLDEHLTKGEITCDEYVDRRRALDFKTGVV
jgi:uncharacterized membrane protein